MSVRTPMTLASVEAEAGLRAAVALDPAAVSYTHLTLPTKRIV